MFLYIFLFSIVCWFAQEAPGQKLMLFGDNKVEEFRNTWPIKQSKQSKGKQNKTNPYGYIWSGFTMNGGITFISSGYT